MLLHQQTQLNASKGRKKNVKINQVTSYIPDLIQGIIWVKLGNNVNLYVVINPVLVWYINTYSRVKKLLTLMLLRRNKIKRNNIKIYNKHGSDPVYCIVQQFSVMGDVQKPLDNHSECTTYTYWLVVGHPSDCRVIMAAAKTTRGAGDDSAALQARQKQQTGNRPACITLQHF